MTGNIARRALAVLLGFIVFAVVVTLVSWLANASSATADDKLVGIEVGHFLTIPAWDNAAGYIEHDIMLIETCRHGGPCDQAGLVAFVTLLDTIEALPRAHQVEAVNRYFNQRPYRSDISLFGLPDLWQPPLAFSVGAGDCEDYAIAKYVALRLLGVAERDLRLMVLLDLKLNKPHAVLEVRDGRQLLILDNRSTAVTIGLAETYRPIYALNRETRWVFAPLPHNDTTRSVDDDG